MESRSRLSIICSHLLPDSPSPTSRLSSSITSSASINDAAGDTRNHQLDCVFCRIVRGESPAFKLYEDETCLCILDSSPLSPGHSLIIPKSHFSCLEATPPSCHETWVGLCIKDADMFGAQKMTRSMTALKVSCLSSERGMEGAREGWLPGLRRLTENLIIEKESNGE